jgi:hypothetical protein
MRKIRIEENFESMAKDTLSAAGLHYLGVRSLLVSARFIAQCLDMDRRLPVGGPD